MVKHSQNISTEFHIHKRTLPHWQSGGKSYFVTFRSAIGELPVEALVETKIAVLKWHCQKYELVFGVVMPDHVHILLRPMEKKKGSWYDLPEIMKGIKGSSARRINILLGRTGTVWQNEYFDRMIRDENEMAEKYRYILNNPLKKELAHSYEDYLFYIEPEELTDGLKSVPLSTI